MSLTEVLAVVVAIIIGGVTYLKWRWTYWKRKGVPYITPRFPFGTSENPFTRKEHFGFRIQRQYQFFKSQGVKHGGLYIFSRPSYLPIHPEYLRNILSRDFQHFTDRGMYFNEKDDPLSAHLFNIGGQKWRSLRSKLTPTFTSGKMKMMFQTLVECSAQLREFMERVDGQPVDIKDVLGKLTTDIIGSCAFGLDCNSFKDPNSDFRKYGKMIFSSVTKLQAVRNMIAFSNPALGRSLGIAMTNKEAAAFFMDVVKKTVDYREKTSTSRNDFMQILLNLKNSPNNDEKLTIEEIAAQAFVFFLAGFETSSTTMSFCLFELALNPDIQDKVREEIKKYDDLSYDAILEMKYLGQVVDETLRKYPPASLVPRKCVEDYQVPGTDVVIEKGIGVMIPIFALHHDPEYFPNPDKFDPGRFSEENKNRIKPFTYLPFGEGPRNCIGLRFGLLETKVGLAVLLGNFRFSLNEKTKIPLELDPFSFILSVKSGIWLDIEKV